MIRPRVDPVKLFSSATHLQAYAQANHNDIKSNNLMATVPRAKERTALSPQTEAMAAGTEKKRKHSHCGKVTRISQIKCVFEEIITNTDPKESEASEILEYLTTAREALEMAGSLLLSNEKMHKILTEPPRPKHDLTLGVPFCSTNGKPVELIQPAQLARRSQVAKHQSASRNKNLAVSQTLSRWLRMHELNGCDRQEEKGPFFPQCSYFLVQLVGLFRRARVINQHVSLRCAIPFHFHNKVSSAYEGGLLVL